MFTCSGAGLKAEACVASSSGSSPVPPGIQVFSNEGEFKNRFGVRGRSPGQLQRPTGVAVHPSGDIIIADYDNKWVSIFSCEGKFKVRRPAGVNGRRGFLGF